MSIKDIQSKFLLAKQYTIYIRVKKLAQTFQKMQKLQKQKITKPMCEYSESMYSEER